MHLHGTRLALKTTERELENSAVTLLAEENSDMDFLITKTKPELPVDLSVSVGDGECDNTAGPLP